MRRPAGKVPSLIEEETMTFRIRSTAAKVAARKCPKTDGQVFGGMWEEQILPSLQVRCRAWEIEEYAVQFLKPVKIGEVRQFLLVPPEDLPLHITDESRQRRLKLRRLFKSISRKAGRPVSNRSRLTPWGCRWPGSNRQTSIFRHPDTRTGGRPVRYHWPTRTGIRNSGSSFCTDTHK